MAVSEPDANASKLASKAMPAAGAAAKPSEKLASEKLADQPAAFSALLRVLGLHRGLLAELLLLMPAAPLEARSVDAARAVVSHDVDARAVDARAVDARAVDVRAVGARGAKRASTSATHPGSSRLRSCCVRLMASAAVILSAGSGVSRLPMSACSALGRPDPSGMWYAALRICNEDSEEKGCSW